MTVISDKIEFRKKAVNKTKTCMFFMKKSSIMKQMYIYNVQHDDHR